MLSIGQPYHAENPTFARGHDDTYDFNYRSDGYELRMFLDRPNPQEAQSVQSGSARFALCEYHSIILLCFKFGAMEWGDAGFNINLVGADERTVPEDASTNDHAILTTIMIDSYSGNVAAFRVCTFSPFFTRQINSRIQKQAAADWCGHATHLRHGQQLYAAYTSAQLAKNLAVAKCRGGDWCRNFQNLGTRDPKRPTAKSRGFFVPEILTRRRGGDGGTVDILRPLPLSTFEIVGTIKVIAPTKGRRTKSARSASFGSGQWSA